MCYYVSFSDGSLLTQLPHVLPHDVTVLLVCSNIDIQHSLMALVAGKTCILFVIPILEPFVNNFSTHPEPFVNKTLSRDCNIVFLIA